MRRAENDADEIVGQDSFLDVVTNIVGIIIVLVMVVGMRSSRAAATSIGKDTRTTHEHQVDESAVRTAQALAIHTQYEVHELVHRTFNHRQEALLREQERQWLQEAVMETEQEIAARRKKLSAQDQHDFDLHRELSEAQVRLDELAREQVALLSREADVQKIECQPTPIAKLVRGKEMHVQLADDHVAVIPFHELTAQVEHDLRQNEWRFKHEDEVVRTIGPIDGFRLQYGFELKEFHGRGRDGGVVAGKGHQFVGAIFLPVTQPLGESAVDAMQPGSEFRLRLQQVDPVRTTITIWTYPGNYDRLRELKSCVRDLGFQTAIRPLPEGCPIGMSPQGTRSVVE